MNKDAKIKLMSTALADAIAAGEVVERPASIVKELVENSLDANADKIIVQIKGSYFEQIRVTDNGEGIEAEDLPQALLRHATSKIYSLDTLHTIASLGFRGEALASVAAVADVKIDSKVEAKEAFSITSTVQDLSSTAAQITASGHALGTSVTVSNLFANVPARKKFLKTEQTEIQNIRKVFLEVSLAYPHVRFELHTPKSKLVLPQIDIDQVPQARLKYLFLKSFAENCSYLQVQSSPYQLWGWVSHPTFYRGRPDNQTLFINNRLVEEKMIAKAIKQAYAGRIYGGNHPLWLLFFDCPAEYIDVNVHPAKSVVRLRRAKEMWSFVHNNVSAHLDGLRPGIESESEKLSFVSNTAATNVVSAEKNDNFDSHKPSLEKQIGAIFERKTPVQSQQTAQPVLMQPSNLMGRALGFIHGAYLLAASQRGLVIVDAHAAHERVILERIRHSKKHDDIQTLLVPEEIALVGSNFHALTESLDALAEQGFLFEVSENKAKLTALPKIIFEKVTDWKNLLEQVLEEFATTDTSTTVQNTIEYILGNIACRMAVRKNSQLSFTDMNNLLREIETVPNSGYCNHGRPTWVEFSTSELDAFFLRGQ